MKSKAAMIGLLTIIIGIATVGVVWAQSTRSGGSAWLGVYTQTVDREIAETFKLPSDNGVIVNRVVSGSPADKAGLREDDVILKYNGTAVNSANELSRQVRRSDIGEKITLGIMRDGKEMTLTATLDDRDEDSDWDTPEAPVAPEAPEAPDMPKVWHYSTGDQMYLGVTLNSLTDQLADYFGVKDGALVSEVDEDSPAAKAGIKAGDVITMVDDEKISDAGDVREIISDMKKGETAKVSVVRNKQTMTFTVAPEVDKNADRRWGSFTMPDIPKINLNLPKTRGLWYGTPQNGFDRDALEKEMDDLHKEMDQLRKELEEMRKDLH